MTRATVANWLPVPIVVFAIGLSAQTSPRAHQARPLVQTGAIPLAGVQGRIDHFSIDTKGHLFISALGNNSEEVLDLTAGGDRAPRPYPAV